MHHRQQYSEVEFSLKYDEEELDSGFIRVALVFASTAGTVVTKQLITERTRFFAKFHLETGSSVNPTPSKVTLFVRLLACYFLK